MDAISAARAAEPGLHVYHFAPYEATAFKRLAGRYATRQDALDELLRDKCLVDLYAVVRQAVRAGVESYSIKELEQYYGYVRQTPLRVASTHRIAIEMALEARDPTAILADTRAIVEAYNREDVESTLYLRNWLEGLRSEQVEQWNRRCQTSCGRRAEGGSNRENDGRNRAQRAAARRGASCGERRETSRPRAVATRVPH